MQQMNTDKIGEFLNSQKQTGENANELCTCGHKKIDHSKENYNCMSCHVCFAFKDSQKQKISKSETREADWFHFADDMQELTDGDGSDWCYECGNEGVIITCCDDLCVGAGECMHGDGEIVCPECGGDY